jgi:hypothetical protein
MRIRCCVRHPFRFLLALVLGASLLAPPASAQGIFDRVKDAVSNTAKEAVDAAKGTAMDEGMNQAGFLMLAEGGFAGTAAPWMVEGEAAAFAEIPGNAYVAPDRLALVLCSGEGALDGIVFQGDFGAVQGKADLYLADQDFTVFLVSGGRAAPMRGNAGQLGSLTAGTLSVEPGESGGVMGTVSLSIGEDAVRGLMPDLFARSRVVDLDGNFRASPVASIEQISCGD